MAEGFKGPAPANRKAEFAEDGISAEVRGNGHLFTISRKPGRSRKSDMGGA
jgi:hypothetical protein